MCEKTCWHDFFHIFDVLFDIMLFGIKYLIYANFVCFPTRKIVFFLLFTLLNRVLDENTFYGNALREQSFVH